jgi:hypothetical protein
MTTSIANRRTIGAITAALVLGTAGPAVARPFDVDAQGSMVPAGHVHRTRHYGRANVLAPYTGSATNYGQANVLPPYMPAPTKRFPETTSPAPTSAASAHPRVSHPAPGSDLIYVLIGGVVVAVAGLGGSLVAVSRRRTAAPRNRIAA